MFTETKWGKVTTDEDGTWLQTPGQEFRVLFFEAESEGAIVTARPDGYLAAWIDQTGQAHEQMFRSASAATRKAQESWGR